MAVSDRDDDELPDLISSSDNDDPFRGAATYTPFSQAVDDAKAALAEGVARFSRFPQEVQRQMAREMASSPDELWMPLSRKQSNAHHFRRIRWDKYWLRLLFDAWACATWPPFIPAGCMHVLGGSGGWITPLPGLAEVLQVYPGLAQVRPGATLVE